MFSSLIPICVKIVCLASLLFILSGCAASGIMLAGQIERAFPESEQDRQRAHNKLIGNYNASKTNSNYLNSLQLQAISIGSFDAYEPKLASIRCRLTKVISPRGTTFNEYIKQAFTDELKAANLFDSESKRTITGKLLDMDLSSYGGKWTFKIELSSNNGASIVVEDSSSFEVNPVFTGGQEACARAQDALDPAIQSVIAKAIRTPEFKKLFL